MNAFWIGTTLLCPSCGYPMRAEPYEHKVSPGKAFLYCEASRCDKRGKILEMEIPTVQVRETDDTHEDRFQRRVDEILRPANA